MCPHGVDGSPYRWAWPLSGGTALDAGRTHRCVVHGPSVLFEHALGGGSSIPSSSPHPVLNFPYTHSHPPRTSALGWWCCRVTSRHWRVGVVQERCSLPVLLLATGPWEAPRPRTSTPLPLYRPGTAPRNESHHNFLSCVLLLIVPFATMVVSSYRAAYENREHFGKLSLLFSILVGICLFMHMRN